MLLIAPLALVLSTAVGITAITLGGIPVANHISDVALTWCKDQAGPEN